MNLNNKLFLLLIPIPPLRTKKIKKRSTKPKILTCGMKYNSISQFRSCLKQMKLINSAFKIRITFSFFLKKAHLNLIHQSSFLSMVKMKTKAKSHFPIKNWVFFQQQLSFQKKNLILCYLILLQLKADLLLV